MVGTVISSLEKSLGVEGLEGVSLGELWGNVGLGKKA